MVAGEPTDEEWVRSIVREMYNPPERAYVTRVYEHTDPDDPWNHEADIILKASGERKHEVPIATSAPGELRLPSDIDSEYSLTPATGNDEGGSGSATGGKRTDDRPECLIEYETGDADTPVITGFLYSDERRSPVGGVNDRRVTVGDATIAIRADESGDQFIQAGFQDDDGATVQPGIIIRPEQDPRILGASGTDILAAASSASGVAPGGPAGGYPSIPTGGAGGDGTGVGDPGFTPSNEVTIAAGGGPINDQLESASGDTLVKLAPGTHTIDPPADNTGVVLRQNQLWIQGQGDAREATTIRFPDGKAGRALNLSGNVALSNLTFDQSTHPATEINVALTGSADSYLYNCRHYGKTPNELNVGPPFSSQASGSSGSGDLYNYNVGMDGGATAHIENCLAKEPEQGIISYAGKNNTGWLQAARGHAGLLEITNCHVAWRGEHSMYCSRAEGDVHVEKGYYSNNINTNMRLSGSGSYIKDATIHLNMDPSRQIEQDTGNAKAARGLRVESGDYGYSGGYCENVDFVHESDLSTSPLIELHSSASDFEVRNCRFWSSNSEDNVVEVTMDGAVFTGCSFVGPTPKIAINGNGDTVVEDTCLSMPNSPGFVDCNTSNISTSGCALPAKKK